MCFGVKLKVCEPLCLFFEVIKKRFCLVLSTFTLGIFFWKSYLQSILIGVDTAMFLQLLSILECMLSTSFWLCSGITNSIILNCSVLKAFRSVDRKSLFWFCPSCKQESIHSILILQFIQVAGQIRLNLIRTSHCIKFSPDTAVTIVRLYTHLTYFYSKEKRLHW